MLDLEIFEELDELEQNDGGVYSEDGIDFLMENDEITPQEAAFMKGWKEAES